MFEFVNRFDKPIVIGVTGPEGIMAKAVKLSGKDAYQRRELFKSADPIVVVDKMRAAGYAKHLPHHMANLFGNSFGFLQHDDIAAMRQAEVTALFRLDPDFIYDIQEGDWLKIVSNGKDVTVEKIA